MCDTIQEKCEKAVAKNIAVIIVRRRLPALFCEEAGLDDETMRNLMQGFGAGLATMEGNLRCDRRSGSGSRNDQ